MKILHIFSSQRDKGTPNYLAIQKKYVLLRTLLLFLLSFSIYFIGYITTKTNQNLLTIVAVLGCLPASRSMVELIMFYRFKGNTIEVTNELNSLCKNYTQGFDFVLTTYHENYQIDHLIIIDKHIYLFRNDKGFDSTLLEKYLQKSLGRELIEDVLITSYTDQKVYVDFIGQQVFEHQPNESVEIEHKILNIICNISL